MPYQVLDPLITGDAKLRENLVFVFVFLVHGTKLHEHESSRFSIGIVFNLRVHDKS